MVQMTQSGGLPRPNPTFGNPSFEGADFRVLIARLSPFHDVDRSTPHLFLFQAVRRALPNAYIDLAFFPCRARREQLEQAGQPLLSGIQSCRPLQDFDLVLISNAYTLELVNLPYLLLRSGAPVMAGQRDPRWPPLILGGSNAMASQAIVAANGDSMVDAIFFGEGERRVERLVRLLYEQRRQDKGTRLARAAAEITGLWASGSWPAQPVQKAVLERPSLDDVLLDYPLLDGSQAGTARLQINWGCPAFCSFCFEGYDRKPYRELPLSDVLTAARRLKQTHGCETLELYSFNLNTHTDILPMLLELGRLFQRVGLKSQRIDLLHHTPGLLEAEVLADKRSFTLGIEGISARLRAWLCKSLAAADIWGLLDRLLRAPIRQIKLFFILTGHENAEDLAEWRAFVRDLKAMRQQCNPGIRVVFSFGLLVRMPFTPLRYDRLFLDPTHWRGIIGPVKSACETNGFEFRMATGWDEYAASQALALGGYGLHEPLTALAGEGHCFDERLSPGYWPALRAWLEAHGYWNETWLGEKGPAFVFPFDFVRTNLRAGFLYEQYLQLKAGCDSGYCLGDVQGRCLGCAACADDERRRAITAHRVRPADATYLARMEEVMRGKRRLPPLYVRLRLAALVAGTTPEWMNAWVLRGLLTAWPELTDNLLSAQESLFTARQNRARYPIFHGETVFALRAWDREALRGALVAGGGADGVEFLSLAQGFTPGCFRQARMLITLPLAHFPDAGPRLVAFLRAAYVSTNTRRQGAVYQLDLPARALKKNVLLEGRYWEEGNLFRAELLVSKFDVGGFLRSLGADGLRLADVEVLEVGW